MLQHTMPITLNGISIDAEYSKASGLTKTYTVHLLNLKHGKYEDGAPKLIYSARDGFDGRKVKTYIGQRFGNIVLKETGEFFDDGIQFTKHIYKSVGIEKFPDIQIRPYRTSKIDIELDARGHAIGWHYSLGRAHFESLDLSYGSFREGSETSRFLTQGRPISYAFRKGDMFHSHPHAAADGDCYAASRMNNGTTIQIVGVTDAGNTIEFAVFQNGAGKPQKIASHRCSSAEFAGILKGGFPRL